MEIPDLISDSYSGEIIILLVVERISTKLFDYLKYKAKKKDALRIKRWKE